MRRKVGFIWKRLRGYATQVVGREFRLSSVMASGCAAVLLTGAHVCVAQAVSDLSLTNTVSNPTPIVGTQVTFQVKVANAGPQSAQRVVVRDRLPAGYSYVSHTATRGTYNPGNGQWSGVAVAARGSVALTIVATVQPSGNRVTVAEVIRSSSTDSDSTPANGNPAEDDYARATTTPQAGDNVAPVITGQLPLTTSAETPLQIALTDLTVTDPDDVYPEGFTLGLAPGIGYAVTAPNEITPDAGFVGTLTVPVTVNDGSVDSAVFNLAVIVIEGPAAPNIVVVMVDDLDVRSLDDLLSAGLMPNLSQHVIDRGVKFSESYVTTPVCCPSRATFLSGQYSHNNGIVSNKVVLPGAGLQWAAGAFDDAVTLATRLQQTGYTTGHVGKYLNGYGSDAALGTVSPAFDPHYVPPGWSYWRGLVDFSTYCTYNYTINGDGVLTQYLRPPEQTDSSTLYQTNVLADLAESFIVDHRDDAAPFYLEVMPLAPHAEQCEDAYGGPSPGQDSFEIRIRPAPEDATTVVPSFVPRLAYDEDVSDKPSWLSTTPMLTATDLDNIGQQYQQRLRAMLSVDRMLGRIVAALGPRIDNTVLIFTSDNGWLYGEHRRSGKIYAYSEASRVPLYIAMPGAVAPTLRSSLVLNNDLAPTIMDMAAPGYSEPQFDGRSLAPLILEPQPPGWTERSQFLIEYSRSVSDPSQGTHPTYRALRSRTRMYVESYDGVYWSTRAPKLIGLELYDLVSDPSEMNSLLHYPEDPVDSESAARLDELVGCAGSACRQYEDAPEVP